MGLCYTEAALKEMLNAHKGTNPTIPVTHVGAFQAGTPLTSVTGSNSTDVFAKVAHGMSNGQVVILSSLTGGSGLNVSKPYFVVNKNNDDFQLSGVAGGSAVDLGSDVSGVTVTPITEISGGSYARQAIAFNAAATYGNGATMDDSTNGAAIPIPAAATVNYLSGHSASSAGTLLWVILVTTESFGGAGTYTATDVDLSLTV